MAAKYILAALAIVFLVLAAARLVRPLTGTGMHPQAKVWLLIGAIFAVVSVYLFLQP